MIYLPCLVVSFRKHGYKVIGYYRGICFQVDGLRCRFPCMALFPYSCKRMDSETMPNRLVFNYPGNILEEYFHPTVNNHLLCTHRCRGRIEDGTFKMEMTGISILDRITNHLCTICKIQHIHSIIAPLTCSFIASSMFTKNH
jgi:hypothetical protein